MISNQFLYFLLSGGLAALLNWGSRFLFSIFLPFEVAVVCAFVVGLITGFVLMRVFVFHGTGKPVAPQIGIYILVNAFALIQTLAISILLSQMIFMWIQDIRFSEGLGHLAGVLIPVVTSYYCHKYLTFR